MSFGIPRSTDFRRRSASRRMVIPALTLPVLAMAMLVCASPSAAQVGAWEMEGTFRRSGFKKGEFTQYVVFGIYADGTYAASESLICGGSCERGVWSPLRNGKGIKLSPTNKGELVTGMVNCLFVNGFVRGSNARLGPYRHTAKLADDGTLEVSSKVSARARFIFGWKAVRGSGTNIAIPTTEQRLADWLSDCFFE